MTATAYRTSVSDMPDRPETRAADLLDLIFDRPAWRGDALCRGDLQWFDRPTDEAKEICARCPVAADCEAVGANEPYGIWAGERKAGLRKETIADRVLDLVTTYPYRLNANEIVRRCQGRKTNVLQAIRQLVAEGRLTVYEVEVGTDGGAQTVAAYGPGEVRP